MYHILVVRAISFNQINFQIDHGLGKVKRSMAYFRGPIMKHAIQEKQETFLFPKVCYLLEFL